MDPVAAQLLNWQPRVQGIQMRDQAMQTEQQIMQQRAMVMMRMQAEEQARQRALSARGTAGGMMEMFGQQPQPQVPPPPTGAPAPPPASLSPGGGNPQVAPPAPGGGGIQPPPGGPAAVAPTQPQMPPPPFRPLPNAAPPGGGAPGMVPPPPAAPPGQDVVAPPHVDMRKVIENLSKLPPDQRLDVFEQLSPVIQKAQQDEVNFFKMQTTAQAAAVKAYEAAISGYKAELAGKTEARREDQGQQRIDQQIARDDARDREMTRKNDISERRMLGALNRIAGGQEKVKGVEYIYPKGEDGKPDQTKPPLGTRGTTSTGKILYMDADGNQTTAAAMAGGTAKEGKGGGGNQQATVRANLVKGSATNALRLLDEVEQKFPSATTSSYFGYHADNPLTKGATAGAKGLTMNQKDRQIDAQWAGIIEEVGPVLSGGLRNSDAFRRFLIDQAPALGDDKKTVASKIKILRDNVAGSSSYFFDKFAGDPKMWGAGVTKEQIEAAKGGAGGNVSRETSGGAAPAQYQEGQTATGPNGAKMVFRGGKWQAVQ